MQHAATLLVSLIGRIIVGAFYLIMAVNHFTNLRALGEYAASKGVPLPGLAVVLSGLLLVFAGASILLGWRPRLGVAALVVFFVAVNLTMHDFWAIADVQERMIERTNFLKNMALMGSALIFATLPRPWPASVDALRRRHPR